MPHYHTDLSTLSLYTYKTSFVVLVCVVAGNSGGCTSNRKCIKAKTSLRLDENNTKNMNLDVEILSSSFHIKSPTTTFI